MPKPSVDHFGFLSPLYERFIRPADPAQLLALLQLAPGQTLLDVGGGTGRITQALVGAGVTLTLLDPSVGMLRQAQGKRCCFPCLGLAEALPFASGSFSRVLAVDSFHHFWDYDRAAAELLRVLAPEGRLVIEEPDVRKFWVKLVALAERLALMRSQFHPPAALAARFHAAGGAVELHHLPDNPNYWAVITHSRTLIAS